MRTVKVRHLYGTGKGAAPWENHSLADFLRMHPRIRFALTSIKVMPPLAVLNNAFSDAKADAGMSGGVEWKPFHIDAQEYQELVEVLCTDPRAELSLDEELDHLSSFEVWSNKAMYKRISNKDNVNNASHGDR